MPIKYIFILFLVCFFFCATFVYADTPTPTVMPTPTVDPVQSSDQTITFVTNFLKGLDLLSGGFIFQTPDIFADTVTLPGGGAFNGLSKFRNLFMEITLPVLVIIISLMAFSLIGSEEQFQLRSFLLRALVVLVLFFALPTLLEKSIEFINALNNAIMNVGEMANPQLSDFANNYFTSASSQIHSGTSPSFFGIPFVDVSNIYSAGVTFLIMLFVQFLLFIIMLLFLVFGFLFIIFQFVIRFVSLIFLSIIFPLVIPFFLSKKTENIVRAYALSWISFLIHQPAFLLGYMLVMQVFTSMIKKGGASLGMLFLYVGALFFLVSTNALITRIFGEPWTAMFTNMQAGIAAATGGIVLLNDLKRGAFSGNATNFRSFVGKQLGAKIGLTTPGQTPTIPLSYTKTAFSKPTNFGSPFSSKLQDKGMNVRMVDKEKGLITIQGTGYAYEDSTNNLRSIYPTKEDAKRAGHNPESLQQVTLSGTYIDPSLYDGVNPNPYNSKFTKKAQQDKRIGNPHITPNSSPDRVANFFRAGKESLEKENIQGVLIDRYDTKSAKERVLRVYTPKKHETS